MECKNKKTTQKHKRILKFYWQLEFYNRMSENPPLVTKIGGTESISSVKYTRKMARYEHFQTHVQNIAFISLILKYEC